MFLRYVILGFLRPLGKSDDGYHSPKQTDLCCQQAMPRVCAFHSPFPVSMSDMGIYHQPRSSATIGAEVGGRKTMQKRKISLLAVSAITIAFMFATAPHAAAQDAKTYPSMAPLDQ